MPQALVFIISCNWLTYLKNTIKNIIRMGGVPIIVDNASTYPPLLEYLKDIEKEFLVYRSPINFGPHGLINNFNIVVNFYKEKTKEDIPHPIMITDPDLDLGDIPDDGIEKLFEAYEKDKAGKYIKYGFSLEYKDIKPESPQKIESIYEQKRLQQVPVTIEDIEGYDSLIDTTFHLYAWQRTNGFRVIYGPAFRLKAPYTCRHIPYYWDAESLKEEEIRYYLGNLKNVDQLGYSKTFKI